MRLGASAPRARPGLHGSGMAHGPARPVSVIVRRRAGGRRCLPARPSRSGCRMTAGRPSWRRARAVPAGRSAWPRPPARGRLSMVRLVLGRVSQGGCLTSGGGGRAHRDAGRDQQAVRRPRTPGGSAAVPGQGTPRRTEPRCAQAGGRATPAVARIDRTAREGRTGRIPARPGMPQTPGSPCAAVSRWVGTSPMYRMKGFDFPMEIQLQKTSLP